MRKAKKSLIGEKRVIFAFPHLALSIIFVALPLFILFAYAFMGKDGSFSLANFNRFASVELWKTIGNSFLMALATTAISLVLCYPLALSLNQIKTNKTFILVMLFVMPMWVNSLLRIIAVKLLFEQLFGRGFVLTLIGMVYDFMPFMLLPLYTVIANTDSSYIEASHDLGASTFKTLLRVRLPLSVSGIVSGVLMVFMPCVSTFAVSEILGGADLIMFGQLINQRFDKDYGVGSAYSIVLMLLIAVSVFIASRVSSGNKVKASVGGSV